MADLKLGYCTRKKQIPQKQIARLRDEYIEVSMLESVYAVALSFCPLKNASKSALMTSACVAVETTASSRSKS